MAVKQGQDPHSEGRRKFLNRLGSLAVYSIPACAAITGGSMRTAHAKKKASKKKASKKKAAHSVPEPGTLALVGLGVAATVGFAARKTRKRGLAARKAQKPKSDD